jgi:hypothetical protein
LTQGASAQMPAGSSYALATTVTKDTGHTPTILRTSTAVNYVVETGGSAQQYIIYDNLIFVLSNQQGGAFYLQSSNATIANGSHHQRISNTTMRAGRNAAGQQSQAGAVFAYGHHFEIVDSHITDGSPPSGIFDSGQHGLYVYATDCLADHLEYSDAEGYCIHAYHTSLRSDRSVYRFLKAHAGSLSRTGARINSTDSMIYYSLIYDSGQAAGSGIIVQGDTHNPTNVRILNNTVTLNARTGINITATGSGFLGASATVLRNNISVSNNPDYTDLGSNTNTTGSTNSWQIASFNADFVNSTARDFHLGTNSSAIGAAGNIDSTINSGDFALTPLVDFDDVSVPQNTTRDIGALERVDPPTTPGAGVGNNNPSPDRRGRIRR